jgi:hypothetical protein
MNVSPVINPVIQANAHNNHRRATQPSVQNQNNERDGSTSFRFMVGSYISRQGLLKELGEVGPTFGFSIYNYFDVDKKYHNGWYILFGLDHFVDTDSTLLQPKFSEEGFTNYIWSFGWAHRYKLNDDFALGYDIGPAINFIEIDTFGTNPELTDYEATDTTISLVQKFSLIMGELNGTHFATALFYYWTPNILGDFARNNLDRNDLGGSSLALQFEFSFN